MGETVSPPQEETGENKPTGEQNRSFLVQWFRERKRSLFLTAALSAAIPLQNEQLTAAEISSGSSWVEGIQTLYKGTRSDPVETVGIFAIDNQTQQGKWIFGKEGLPKTVEFSPLDVGMVAANEFSETTTKSVTLCGLHTHPIGTSSFASYIVSAQDWELIREGKKYLSIPPSMPDISSSSINLWHVSAQKLGEKGIAADIRFGVIDAAGLTYYQPITDQKLKQEYPEYFKELEQRSAISNTWENTINPILDHLDNTTLDRLHPLAFRNVLYDTTIPENASSNNPEIKNIKHKDLKDGLNDEYHREDIARELFANNLQAHKAYRDYVTQVLDKEQKDQDLLYEAATDWIKISLTANPDQLPNTEQYKKLRAAYARNGASIRFVPLQRVADEPPCAGTEYRR